MKLLTICYVWIRR